MQLRIDLTSESKRAIARWGERGKQIKPTIAKAAARGAQLVVAEILQHELRGKALRWLTGTLAGSLTSNVVVEGDTVIARVGVWKGAASKYARIHEMGGVIRPVKGKYLAIPLDAVRGPGGKPSFSGPRKAQAEKYPDMFLLKRRGKDPLLCAPRRVAGRGKGKGRVRGLIPLFALKKSVKIPARHWLSGGVRSHREVFRVTVQRDVDAVLAA